MTFATISIREFKGLSFLLSLLGMLLTTASCGPSFKYFGESSTSRGSVEFEKSQCVRQFISPSPIKKLNRRELSNTLKDLFGRTIVNEMGTLIDLVPSDYLESTFDNIHQNISPAHIEGAFELASAISGAVIENGLNIGGLKTCIDQGASEKCIRAFIKDFGLLVLRRPLEMQQQQALWELYQSNVSLGAKNAAKSVLLALLQMPQFYFFIEDKGQAHPSNSNILILDDYEIASRLSYAFTGSMPDSQLFEAARNGELRTPDQITYHANRLLDSSKGRQHIENFYSQLLHLDAFPSLDYSSAFLDNFSHSMDGLDQAMKREALDFLLHYTLDRNGTFEDIMQSRVSFIKSPALAAIYGIQPSQEASGRVTLPEDRRGVLTRVGVLANGRDRSQPFHRGYVINRDFFCQTFGRPDPDLISEALQNAPKETTVSTREYSARITESKDCMSCHQFMNSFGFAFEQYDGLGRYQTVEKFYDGDQLISSFPVDANVTISTSNGPQSIQGVGGLSDVLATNEKSLRCFSSQWYRFTQSRPVSLKDENCAVSDLAQKAVSEKQGGLRSMLIQAAQLPEFRLRVITNQKEEL